MKLPYEVAFGMAMQGQGQQYVTALVLLVLALIFVGINKLPWW